MDRQRLHDLVNLHFDDEITSEQQAELEAMLLCDDEARRWFWQYAQFEASLRDASQRHTVDDAEDAIETRPQPVTGSAGNSLQTAAGNVLDWRGHPVPFFTLIAALTLVAWIGFLAFTRPGARDPQRPSVADRPLRIDGAIAWLAGQDRARWEGFAPTGAGMHAGQQLVLESGLAELHYKTGAIVILEGPAEFTVGTADDSLSSPATRHPPLATRHSHNSGYLALGKLVARVEGKDAKGFTVAMPHARVEDLGTEFGVHVQRDGAVDVVVLAGEVDVVREAVAGASPQRIRLTKGQGAFVAAGGARITRRETVDAQQIAELRERIDADLAPPPAQVALNGLSVYYRADNVDGRGSPGDGSTRRLVNLASPGTRDGTIVDGSGIIQNSAPVGTPFEYGVVLSGANQTHIQASSYQIAGGTNRVASATWEFWLRADRAQMDGRGALYGEFPASAGTRHYLRLEGIGTATGAALYDEWLPSGNSTTSDSQLFNTSALTQLVVTKRGDTLTFYRNGARVGATKSHSETYSGGGITRTLFGKRADQNESFDGQFNIIRVYDRVLTAAEVNTNYRAEIGAKADRHNEGGTANLR